jgi:TrmH family RNA methyltransferase
MLDAPKSERVKGVARLQQKDARLETGLFLLEGPQGLKELCKQPELAHEVFATANALDRYEDLFDQLYDASVPIIEVSDLVMEKLADTKTPQGVVAVVSQFDVSLEELIASGPQLIAILDQARDPGNGGTVIRAADAAGADAVIFTTDSVDLYNPKLVRLLYNSLQYDKQQLKATQIKPAAQVKTGGTSGSIDPDKLSPEEWLKWREKSRKTR